MAGGITWPLGRDPAAAPPESHRVLSAGAAGNQERTVPKRTSEQASQIDSERHTVAAQFATASCRRPSMQCQGHTTSRVARERGEARGMTAPRPLPPLPVRVLPTRGRSPGRATSKVNNSPGKPGSLRRRSCCAGSTVTPGPGNLLYQRDQRSGLYCPGTGGRASGRTAGRMKDAAGAGKRAGKTAHTRPAGMQASVAGAPCSQ